MGTTVQCKSYKPGCYPMRDLNEDPISSWSLCHQDKIFCGQLYNDFMAGPSYGYSEYDKEMLKRTMLEQEAIFQNQVYELHRLYQIQKDLMDELKKKKMHGSPGAMDASNSNMLAYQMAPEAGDKLCHVPHPSAANTHYSTVNAAGLEEKKASSYLLKEVGLQSSSKSTENIGPLKDHKELDSKLKTFPKRMFDLHLPADVYIRCEDTERMEKDIVTQSCVSAPDPRNVICSVEPENSAKLDVGTIELFSCKKDTISNMHLRNDHLINGLAGLNEEVKDLHAGGSADLGAITFNDVKSHSKKVEVHLTTLNSKTSFLPGDFVKDIHREEGTCSRCFNADKEEIRRNWPMLHNDSSQNRSSDNSFNSGPYDEKCAMSSESIQLKHKEVHEYLPDQNKKDTWFGKSKQPVENSEISPDLVNLNCPALTVTQLTRPLSVNSTSDHVPITTPPASSWRKTVRRISHIPVAVQALPCFTGSAMINGRRKNHNSANGCDKLQSKGTLQPPLRLDTKSSRNMNGLLNGFQLESKSATQIQLSPITREAPKPNVFSDNLSYESSESHETQNCIRGLKCTDVKTAKDLNLNLLIRNEIQEGLGSQKDLSRKHDESSRGLFGLKKPENIRSLSTTKYSTQMGSQLSEDNTQMTCSFDKVAEEIARECEKDKVSSQCVLESSMPLQAKEGGVKRNGMFDGPGKGTSSVSFLNEILQSSNCSKSVSYHKQSSCNEKGNSVRISNRRFKYDINLDSGLICVDDPKLSVISAEDEAGFTSSTYVIDLGTPFIELEKDDPVPQGDTIETNHLKNDLNMSQELKSFYDTSLRVAADTIVSMSMDVHNNLDNCSPLPLAPASCNILCWFTEVVASSLENSGVPKGRGDGDSEALDDDGVDLFEAMTLKLQEVKEEEYWCRSFQGKLEDEQKSSASLLLTRPRRVQGRKRRQRRDFQKDILPALASLSRHEVTEDLQTLGGTIRASCNCAAKRSTGRNGLNSWTRGRRQPRSLAITIADVHANHPPIQPTHAESVVDARTTMGWGKTTRRGRRQRVNGSIPQE